MAHDMPGADSIGHLCATALVFISLFTLGWGVAVIFAFLHSVHAFPDQIFELVSRLEVGLIYSTLQYAESFSLPVSCASFARSWRKMMPRQITEPLLEGFLGALQLFVAIVAAPWKVVKAFVERTPRSASGRAHR